MNIRLIKPFDTEGHWISFLWRTPYFGVEMRVTRTQWLWIGYTTRSMRERGW